MRCLIQFYDEWLDFRIAEVSAILQMYGLKWEDMVLDAGSQQHHHIVRPDGLQHFYVVEFPNEDVIRCVCSRSVLIKAVYELWGSASSLNDLAKQIEGLPRSFLDPYLCSSDSWAVQINSFGHSLSLQEKQLCRLKFKFLDFNGPVDVKHAKIELWLSLDYSNCTHLIKPSLVPRVYEEHGDQSEGVTAVATTVASAISAATVVPVVPVGPPAQVPPVQAEAQVPFAPSASPPVPPEPTGQYVIPAYFGRLVATGGMKEVMRKYDLKKRKYLGPTSLDDGLALILANLSLVQAGACVYDPFVGTASILVALANFGAVCWGSDIDTRVLKGDMHAGANNNNNNNNNNSTSSSTGNASSTGHGSKNLANNSSLSIGNIAITGTSSSRKGIFANFIEYGLPLPELIRMDNHLFDRHIVLPHSDNHSNDKDNIEIVNSTVPEGFFDAIVTDPPYGIRAGAKKSGKPEPLNYEITPEQRVDHIPRTQRYPVEEVMLDLLHTAARSLNMHGRLTYLLPTAYNFTEQDLPYHPCLRLVQICHQSLSARYGRRAVVMEKYCQYTIERQTEFRVYKECVMQGRDAGFGQLMQKLLAALDTTAFENDAVVKQMSVCSSKRKVSKERRQKWREEGIQFPPKKFPEGFVPRISKKKLAKKEKADVNNNINDDVV